MLKLRDTMSGEVRPFIPADPHRVTLWCCGPTVYDVPHVGNARSAVVFDVLYRVLTFQYGEYEVSFARNYTDIDDKIIARAAEQGISIGDLTSRTTMLYDQCMGRLGCLLPSYRPSATAHISEMQSLISTLIQKGFAYEAEGHVLFDISKHQDHGKLSGQSMDKLRAGARVEPAPYKRDQGDFVLWKPSTADQPGWESPWGRGRPGWHIECSAMIQAVLGTTIDIHGGGNDLIFPHHEAEIAQSECAHGEPLARYWIHNGLLTVDGQKMSKSAGNFVTVPDALEQAHGQTIRYLLLSGHYHQPLDWTSEKLVAAKSALDTLYRAKEALYGNYEPEADMQGRGVSALMDDLNTPKALAAFHEIAQDVNRGTGDNSELNKEFITMSVLLGIGTLSPDQWFGRHISAAQHELITKRSAARARKDWAESDRIRAELLADGIVVEDTGPATSWRRI